MSAAVDPKSSDEDRACLLDLLHGYRATCIVVTALKLGLVDFVRMAGGDLDPGKALLTGRMDMEGDLAVAARLGEMFGQPAAI